MPRLLARRAAPALALIALTAAPADLAGAHRATAAKSPVRITVMTRNLYLGADLIPAALAKDQQQLQQAATTIVDHVHSTDFPARSKLIAAEVAKAKPDLIALQEVATWRRGPHGQPAKTVVYDWMRLLRKRLSARGLHYRIVARKQEFDFQLPTSRGYDARLTLQDAILAGPRVKVRRSRSAGFKHILSIPTLAGPASIHRAYDSITASVGGVRFRFVNTHLEAYSATIREQQAKELVAGPLKGHGPIVLAGDLNSDKVPAQPGDTLAFQAIAGAGFVDRASRKPSCCHDDSTLRKNDHFDHIVDHVMTKPGLRASRRSVTGDGPRGPGGLWPSDHGGLVVTLRLR